MESFQSVQSRLTALDTIIPVPEFVKQAAERKEEARDQLPLSAFAGIGRQYPVDSKASTWLSCCEFVKKAGNLTDGRFMYIEGRLSKAAADYGLDFDAIRNQYAAASRIEKPADEKWALVVENDLGEKIRLYPLPNRESLKAAAEHFYTNRFRYPYEWRRKIAREILSELGSYDDVLVAHEDYLHKAAGYGFCSPYRASLAFAVRAKLLESDMAETMEKFATSICMEKLSAEQIRKYCGLLALVDEAMGLTDLYTEALPMPEEIFFSESAKSAQELIESSIRLSNGEVVTVEQLKRTPLVKAAQAIGGNTVSRLMGGHLLPDMDIVKQALSELLPHEADTFCLFVPEESQWKNYAYLRRSRA